MHNIPPGPIFRNVTRIVNDSGIVKFNDSWESLNLTTNWIFPTFSESLTIRESSNLTIPFTRIVKVDDSLDHATEHDQGIVKGLIWPTE